MGTAAFLLVINFSIGLGFASAFLMLGWRRPIPLAPWCAAGFVAATGTVTAEALASVIPSVRLTSTLSFTSLLLALALIASGLMRQFRPGGRIGWLFAIVALASTLNALFLVDQPRGTLLQGLGYQGPFALMAAIAAAIILSARQRSAVDLSIAVVLLLSSVQFLLKGMILAAEGKAPGVRDYISSTYAFYSQTAGSILALLLGITLVSKVALEALAETAREARRDALSGALTRGAFMEEAGALLARSATGAPLAVVMADLDHFKSVNDRFGHAAGDQVIEAFGATLISLAGPDGLCGRIGGEEFCVLMAEGDPESVRIRVEMARAMVAASHPSRLPPGTLVTASFGIAFLEQGESLVAAMHRADLALYAAKGAGRNAWRFATPSTLR